MNCKNCSAKIEDNTKFCASCGMKVEAGEKTDVKNLNAIKNHLEFLGYKVELTEAKKNDEATFFVATHSKDANLVAVEIEPFLTTLRANFTTEKPHSSEMDSAINELCSKLDVANVFYKVEDDKVVLYVDAVYTGEYSKDIFGRFFALLNKDISKIFLLESTKKAFTN